MQIIRNGGLNLKKKMSFFVEGGHPTTLMDYCWATNFVERANKWDEKDEFSGSNRARNQFFGPNYIKLRD